MAKIVNAVFSIRQAKTFEGIKRGGKKLGFYFGIDPIPSELYWGVTIVDDGNALVVENLESGKVTIPVGHFVAYEAVIDPRCPHGYNCWEKSNAATTIVKTADGYVSKGEEVECCITANGALPWFLTDEHAPELRIFGNEMEIKGVNGAWQRATIGNSFFVYYKREVDGIHDVALVDADTEAAKVYDAMINVGTEVISFPLLHFIGSVA